MLQPSEIVICQIEGSLSIGMRVFIHRRTGECIDLPEEEYLDFGDEDANWEDLVQRVEDEDGDFVQVPKWKSHEAFSVMEEFAQQLSGDELLRHRLLDALRRRKPFMQFNEIIHEAGPYREQWFDFRTAWQRSYVRKWFQHLEEQDMGQEDE